MNWTKMQPVILFIFKKFLTEDSPLFWRRWRAHWCRWAVDSLCWRSAAWAWSGRSSPERGRPSAGGGCTPRSPVCGKEWLKSLSKTVATSFCILHIYRMNMFSVLLSPRAASRAESLSSWAAVWDAAAGSPYRERTSAPCWAFWSTCRLNWPSWKRKDILDFTSSTYFYVQSQKVFSHHSAVHNYNGPTLLAAPLSVLVLHPSINWFFLIIIFVLTEKWCRWACYYTSLLL